FSHVPFPSSEIFRQLPVRREVLEGIVHADLIGFHDYSYLRHFCSSLSQVLGVESSMLSVRWRDHEARLGVFPVSIDVPGFKEQASRPGVRRIQKALQRGQSVEKLILGVDRLDYIKGVELKLRTFRRLLELNPEFRGKVGLLQLAVPTRTDVPGYIQLKFEIDQLVGEINGEFGTPNYAPVQYMFTSVPFEQLLALYRLADVLLVTSKRDGMNLVALEYIVTQRSNDPGVVVLSEFAGAISTLSHVIRINPWDVDGTAEAVRDGLRMERNERVRRHRTMMQFLDSYHATHWAESFMKSLGRPSAESAGEHTIDLTRGSAARQARERIRQLLADQDLLIFLDYDGTMVPIAEKPELATLSPAAKERFARLVSLAHVDAVVVSGRDSEFLEQQLAGIPVSVAAEHGAQFAFRPGSDWKRLVHGEKRRWRAITRRIMSDYTARVPGSFIERKRFGLCWHYRQSPQEFAAYQARKLKRDLDIALANLPVSVIAGRRVLEVRAGGADKGSFVRWYLENHPEMRRRTIIAIGDDRTDEDIFAAVRRPSVTIRVGAAPTSAEYRIESQTQVLELLEEFSSYGGGQLGLPGIGENGHQAPSV
ncbi:MAG: trehalose-phosphatase, partial [Bdellovibrionales bacterium]|nr:trehalose-phosphatase [Bdellovibrionales bacterium]